ncbi:MAG: hypothetical protein Q7V62_03815 [Actinomycetota bacterium]|nr:hypothetical protein [Actinomycetota bacterium]
MKVRIATVLSLAGVLVAGSAAAMVNTQVLRSDGGNDVQIASDVTLSNVTIATGTVTTTPTDPASPTPTPTTVASSTTQAVYQIGEAGLVTLDSAGGVLTVVSVVPNPGWIVAEAESEDAYNVEVKFQSAFTVLEFHANLLFGVIGTSVESKNLDLGPVATTSEGSSSSTPSSGSVDDGGDDDDDDDSSGHGGGDDDDDDKIDDD